MSTLDGSSGENKSKPGLWFKVKNFWIKYEDKIILAVGIILIAGISFEAGFLYNDKRTERGIVIEKNNCLTGVVEGSSESKSHTNPKADAGSQSLPTEESETGSASAETKECAFVGSKNSDKYHLPNCRWANKIKPENRVCFSSKEDAESRGYKPAKCCIK